MRAAVMLFVFAVAGVVLVLGALLDATRKNEPR